MRVPDSYPDRDVRPVSGVSLKPIFDGESLNERPPIHFQFQANRGLRLQDWKLVSFGGRLGSFIISAMTVPKTTTWPKPIRKSWLKWSASGWKWQRANCMCLKNSAGRPNGPDFHTLMIDV